MTTQRLRIEMQTQLLKLPGVKRYITFEKPSVQERHHTVSSKPAEFADLQNRLTTSGTKMSE